MLSCQSVYMAVHSCKSKIHIHGLSILWKKPGTVLELRPKKKSLVSGHWSALKSVRWRAFFLSNMYMYMYMYICRDQIRSSNVGCNWTSFHSNK